MKLGQFKTPTGGTGNVLNVNDWMSYILGGVVLLITFATSQNLVKGITGKAKFIDGEIEPIVKQPLQKKSNAPGVINL